MWCDGRRRPARARASAVFLAAATLSCGRAERGPGPGDPAPATVLSASRLIGRSPPGSSDAPTIEGALALAAVDSFVYVLDATAASVRRFDLEAHLRGTFGRRGDGPGELAAPVGVAAAPDGSVWVSDPGSGRLVRFDSDGAVLADVHAGVPPVNLAVVDPEGALVPTTSAGTLLVRVATTGTRILDVEPGVVPVELRGGPRDRVSLRGLLLAGLPGRSLALLRNRSGTDFRLWVARLGEGGSRIEAVDHRPLPGWLTRLLEEETEAARRTVPPGFAEGDFFVPFKGLHASGGRIWLVPTPSSRLIALSVTPWSDDDPTVVVGDRGVWEGLLDAVVVDDRLVALYHTELRVYELEAAPGAFSPD